jgi:hypothetical protein
MWTHTARDRNCQELAVRSLPLDTSDLGERYPDQELCRKQCEASLRISVFPGSASTGVIRIKHQISPKTRTNFRAILKFSTFEEGLNVPRLHSEAAASQPLPPASGVLRARSCQQRFGGWRGGSPPRIRYRCKITQDHVNPGPGYSLPPPKGVAVEARVLGEGLGAHVSNEHVGASQSTPIPRATDPQGSFKTMFSSQRFWHSQCHNPHNKCQSITSNENNGRNGPTLIQQNVLLARTSPANQNRTLAKPGFQEGP